MKPEVRVPRLTSARPSLQPAQAPRVMPRHHRSRSPGESVLPGPNANGESLDSSPPPRNGRKFSPGAGATARAVIVKRALVVGKVALGLGMAGLTMNLVAIRMYNLPVAPNSVFGEVHAPGKQFRQQIEGNGSGVWTSNCVRRASLPSGDEKPVLILGDSYTEAIQVRDEEHFAHLLEQRLGGIPVLAVGRAGCSVADYVAGAPTFKRLFTPAWVIIPVTAGDFQADAWAKKEGGYAYFEGGNDAARVATPGAQDAAGASAHMPGSLEVVSLPFQKPGWLSTVTSEECPFLFPLVTFAYLRKSAIEAWIEDQQQPWFRAAAGKPGEAGLPRDIIGGYPLGNEMKLLAEAYERRLTLLYLAKFDPADPTKEAEIEKALHGLALKYGVRFVSLREKFPELAAAGQAPYGFGNTRFNWGHWNRYGHRAAAELLAEECQRLGVHR